MIALPAAGPAPLITRPATSRAHAPARPEASADAPTADAALDAHIARSVDTALAEALAKVKTPEDDEVAQQQAAFDKMMQQRAENLREANAIREFGLAQAKKEDEFMTAFIRMI